MNFLAGRYWPVGFILLMILQSGHLAAASLYGTQQPAVAIVIDDMGKRLSTGRRVVSLPGPVACSFLPHAQHSRYLAAQAHKQGKEVLLHLPMESVDRRPLDAGGMSLDMTESEFIHTLREDIDAVPYLSGVNNHMGSLLTRHPGHMAWLMQELQRKGKLYFVDSRTTSATVARHIAREWGVPNSERNVFLDNINQPAAVSRQVDKLVASAKKHGTALAIGHPYRTTLKVLKAMLPQLSEQGVRLVSVSELIRIQKEESPWQASLFPSPRAAKSSKP